jgi:hypothetical protein
MPLIKEIEVELPLLAALPDEWQKDVAVILSRVVIAYDHTLTMSPDEQKARRDEELAAFQRRFSLGSD